MATKSGSGVKSIYRGLLKEFSHRKQVGTPAYNYLIKKYKTNEVTSDRYCRGTKAAHHDAANYFNLLKSSRLYDELLVKYHGDGEDSLRKAANRVGLQLPEEYQDSETK